MKLQAAIRISGILYMLLVFQKNIDQLIKIGNSWMCSYSRPNIVLEPALFCGYRTLD